MKECGNLNKIELMGWQQRLSSFNSY